MFQSFFSNMMHPSSNVFIYVFVIVLSKSILSHGTYGEYFSQKARVIIESNTKDAKLYTQLGNGGRKITSASSLLSAKCMKCVCMYLFTFVRAPCVFVLLCISEHHYTHLFGNLNVHLSIHWSLIYHSVTLLLHITIGNL